MRGCRQAWLLTTLAMLLILVPTKNGLGWARCSFAVIGLDTVRAGVFEYGFLHGRHDAGDGNQRRITIARSCFPVAECGGIGDAGVLRKQTSVRT